MITDCCISQENDCHAFKNIKSSLQKKRKKMEGKFLSLPFYTLMKSLLW